MQPKRIILTFKDGEELVVHALYCSKTPHSPTPNTKARIKEVSELTRDGLERALEALEGAEAKLVDTSGFTTREDVLLATTERSA